MNRETIIANMCYTFRHDFGILKQIGDSITDSLSSGVTEDERLYIWNTMAQIFDNDIAPHMEFKRTTTSRNICGND